MSSTPEKGLKILIWVSFILSLVFFIILASYRTYFGNKLTHIMGFGVVINASILLSIITIIISSIYLKKFEESKKGILSLLILSVVLLLMIFPAWFVAIGGPEPRDPTLQLAVAHNDISLCNYLSDYLIIDGCYAKIAYAENKPELCGQLPPRAPYTESDRSGCLDRIKAITAINKQDSNICVGISDELIRNACYERTNATAQESAANFPSPPSS